MFGEGRRERREEKDDEVLLVRGRLGGIDV